MARPKKNIEIPVTSEGIKPVTLGYHDMLKIEYCINIVMQLKFTTEHDKKTLTDLMTRIRLAQFELANHWDKYFKLEK